jgi:hypothetical protein
MYAHLLLNIPSCSVGTGLSFPGVKQLAHEADHSSALSAEVKNEFHYTSSPPYVFKACMIILSGIMQVASGRRAYCLTDGTSVSSAK